MVEYLGTINEFFDLSASLIIFIIQVLDKIINTAEGSKKK
jgi:hypothetical protein